MLASILLLTLSFLVDMNLKAALLAIAASFVSAAAPVAAGTRPNTGTFNDHVRLYDTIHAYGVRVVINDYDECSKGIDGSYWSRERVLHVCQDNARPGEREIDWTANDLDTLRHEAHHMIQDCALGSLGDRQLIPLFGSEDNVMEFVRATLGEERARAYMNNPAYQGRPHVHLKEMEAFAAAYAIPAHQIADKMVQVCS